MSASSVYKAILQQTQKTVFAKESKSQETQKEFYNIYITMSCS
jgi:hypothetical protein